jgi:hypothetical protein
MLRPDESTAWTGFLAAAPQFADEDIARHDDGPDPPDVLCAGIFGKVIGVELTKWIEHDQVTEGRGRELLENSYLKIIGSESEPRPEHIGRVFLHYKSLRVKQNDALQFRTQLFDLLAHENAKPLPSFHPQFPIPTGYWNTVREWDTPQGAPICDFIAYPMLERYLNDVWIYPRESRTGLPVGMPWILFETPGGAYTEQWMVQAAVDRILAKITKYEHDDIRMRHALGEFDLVCFYCDEALLHNTPIHVVGFDFPQLAARVEQALAAAPRVFDRIFLFHPYEDVSVVQVYGEARDTIRGNQH